MANAANIMVPKQWPHGEVETFSSFECWRNNLPFFLSLNKDFDQFLSSNCSKKSHIGPGRVPSDTVDQMPDAKFVLLERMLGQIANYAPIVSRKSIVNQSVCQQVRLHYGFNPTDLSTREPGGRPVTADDHRRDRRVVRARRPQFR